MQTFKTQQWCIWLMIGLSLVHTGCDQPPPDGVVEQAASKSVSHARNTLQDRQPSGWPAKTLPEIAAALKSGEVSAEFLVQAYLERIEALDRDGPKLQSVLSLNPEALSQARAADQRRAAGEALGSLHGVPILLKDNIESRDPLPTTAGALALRDNVTDRDAPLVQGLREAGAIILGKTNLSQWANFRSTQSLSGWSALGGQVRNPHMLDRNPCGSSSGSGAAMAASLAAGTVGTETNGSIICPSSVNGVVGFKPTVGLVSQEHIIPISFVQDTAGPMTKTVTGAAMMLSAMADAAEPVDYVASLDTEALQGVRIGVMRFTEPTGVETKRIFEAALADLAAAGAVLVDIQTFVTNVPEFREQATLALRYEFKAGLNAYLADSPAALPVRTLRELVAFNQAHRGQELVLFGQELFLQSVELGSLEETAYVDARVAVNEATRQNGIDALLAQYDVQALVTQSGMPAPRVDPIHGDVWPSGGGGGWLAAMAGYPHITVPMGDVRGLPVGLSFIAAKNEDSRVLALGYAYEQRTQRRIEPRYWQQAEQRPEIDSAMNLGR